MLDLSDAASHSACAASVASRFGRCDVLVNNAAVCFNSPTLFGRCAHTSFERQAEITVRTNFRGTLGVTRAFLPLLRQSASPRVVNVASAAGRLSILKSRSLRDAFTDARLDLARLETLMQQFVDDVQGSLFRFLQHRCPRV